MNSILPFIKQPKAEFFLVDEQALTLVLHLKRLKRSGESVHQTTGFGLADQVMTHLLVTSGAPFDLIVRDLPADRDSIHAITVDRYGLVDVSEGEGLIAADLLAGWPIEALVQYVLDHEVPIDPRDMPGFSDLRLAG